MSFQKHEQNGLVWFTADALNAVPHGFSTRRGGVSPAPWDSLNLRPSQGDGPEALWENYHRFFAALGLNESRAVLSQQTHTANIRRVTAADAGKGLLRPRDYTDVDALITDEPGLSLTVFFRRLRHGAAVRSRKTGHRRRSCRVAGLCRGNRPENRGRHV